MNPIISSPLYIDEHLLDLSPVNIDHPKMAKICLPGFLLEKLGGGEIILEVGSRHQNEACGNR